MLCYLFKGTVSVIIHLPPYVSKPVWRYVFHRTHGEILKTVLVALLHTITMRTSVIKAVHMICALHSKPYNSPVWETGWDLSHYSLSDIHSHDRCSFHDIGCYEQIAWIFQLPFIINVWKTVFKICHVSQKKCIQVWNYDRIFSQWASCTCMTVMLDFRSSKCVHRPAESNPVEFYPVKIHTFALWDTGCNLSQ